MASGPMKNQYWGVKYQEFNQTVAITQPAGIGYYTGTPITLTVPDGYTPVGVQWIDDWSNMVIPIFRVNNNLYRLYFMCTVSIATVTPHVRVIYARKD